jgi:hypothetical protein
VRLVGHFDGWDRSAWPTPAFGRFEELTGRAFKVTYDDVNPNALLQETPIDPSELASMPNPCAGVPRNAFCSPNELQ